ncbi:HAD-IIB family hydrolase [Thiomicrorhabdus immobilis]|uniref:HAD-IIB family hydrolase n=1 Tax=Thiomicrorhabdus immobilis TaxID=2791037 RepID=UPI001F2ADDE4|nr:HAD-IIB family hydrolase [Thiomicrorhabdus immobilis]
MSLKKLLFTDLDGSLLNHHDYDYSSAMPAMQRLNSEQIPWILTTSKTAAEVVELKAELNNPYPFIVENGAGIFWSKESLDCDLLLKSLVSNNASMSAHANIENWGDGFQYLSLNLVSLPQILQLARDYKTQHGIDYLGFSEMDAQQVMGCTGLSFENALKAKQRNFSEPLLWKDSEQASIEFKRAMSRQGLQVLKGGRFVHLMGLSNKGLALKVLEDYYQQAWQSKIETMALGDGDNDISLLEASDNPVIISSPVNPAPLVKHNKVFVTQENGPKGWNQAVLDWLELD